jgi:hypothetical protein
LTQGFALGWDDGAPLALGVADWAEVAGKQILHFAQDDKSNSRSFTSFRMTRTRVDPEVSEKLSIQIDGLGFRPSGAKALLILLAFSARLKSCPVTKHPRIEFFRRVRSLAWLSIAFAA